MHFRESQRHRERQTDRQRQRERQGGGRDFTRYKSDTVLNIRYIPHTLRESNYILLGTDSIQSCTHHIPHRPREGHSQGANLIQHCVHTIRAKMGLFSEYRFNSAPECRKARVEREREILQGTDLMPPLNIPPHCPRISLLFFLWIIYLCLSGLLYVHTCIYFRPPPPPPPAAPHPPIPRNKQASHGALRRITNRTITLANIPH